MMAGNPNWWSMNNGMHLQSHEFVYGSTSPLSSSSNPSPPDPHTNGQDFPVRSWSQLLLGGLGNNEEERYGGNLFQHQKKLENWEEQVLNLNSSPSFTTNYVKQEVSHSRAPSQFYGGHLEDHEFQGSSNYKLSAWPPYNHHQQVPVSSPTSCITTLSNNFLNFSGGKSKNQTRNQDHSSECNSTGTGGASKKARVTQSAQPALKVRKEKLGDRITALHQLVSPFGKTDTASVLSEAIGYIRFLEGQIEALSTPYMRNASGSTRHHQHSVQERNCLFPDEGGQFLNDVGIESKGASKLQDSKGRSGVKDLRSRGLCLVPISCTEHVGNENGADYWAPAAIGGGF